MDAHKIVVHEVDRQRVDMVLHLFAERIRYTRKPTDAHSHRKILALDVAGIDVLAIRLSANHLAFRG